MIRSSLALLLASTAAGAIIACSSGPDSGGLLGKYNGNSSGGPSASSSSGGGSGSGSGSGGMSSSSGGSSSGGSSSGGSSSGGIAPPPDAGPGSTTSPAHVYFNATVYPELAPCAACHSSGVNGAPKMMVAPADNTYSELDALALIQANSLLLTKGAHDTGKAPVLASNVQADITTWLNMEAQERAGTAAPTNVLAEVAKCASQTEFEAILWKNLKTIPRNNENPNRCTGCNKAICASCHESGEQGFYMSEGSNIQPPGTTFQQTFTGTQASTFMIKYFGLNGTTPVASNAIMLKQQAVAVGPAYSHPMFTMDATMTAALDKFVTDAITNYTNKTCTGGAPADAGTD